MFKRKFAVLALIAALITTSFAVAGCSSQGGENGKTVITMLQYKPEAVAAFEEIEERFNATHDDIELRIESPNEAMTVLKTRLIKEDYPDIVGIGGDINYSNFLDTDLFMDISDFDIVNITLHFFLKDVRSMLPPAVNHSISVS